LVDLEWGRQGRRPVLRLYVDKPGGVTVGECESLSREAGDVLDVSGLIEPSYDLEVSSPGLDRELRKDREFAWAVGREVRMWLREAISGRLEVAGRLRAAGPEGVAIELASGEVVETPRSLIAKARLEPPMPGRAGPRRP
ncbi:MAG TPA: ribosome maturation factor RimP, partial [Vicinamibacteria bacterium]